MKKVSVILLMLFGGFYMASIQEMLFMLKNVKNIKVIDKPFEHKIEYDFSRSLGLANDKIDEYYLRIDSKIYHSHIKSYDRYLRFFNVGTTPKIAIIIDNKGILL